MAATVDYATTPCRALPALYAIESSSALPGDAVEEGEIASPVSTGGGSPSDRSRSADLDAELAALRRVVATHKRTGKAGAAQPAFHFLRS